MSPLSMLDEVCRLSILFTSGFDDRDWGGCRRAAFIGPIDFGERGGMPCQRWYGAQTVAQPAGSYIPMM